MPKSICTNCQTELKPYKKRIYLIEMFQNPPEPYKVWSADLWKCKGCGVEIISGFGTNPLMEHYESDFTNFINEILSKDDNSVYYDYEKPQN